MAVIKHNHYNLTVKPSSAKDPIDNKHKNPCGCRDHHHHDNHGHHDNQCHRDDKNLFEVDVLGVHGINKAPVHHSVHPLQKHDHCEDTVPPVVLPGVYTRVTVDAQGKVIYGDSPTKLSDLGISDIDIVDLDFGPIPDNEIKEIISILDDTDEME